MTRIKDVGKSEFWTRLAQFVKVRGMPDSAHVARLMDGSPWFPTTRWNVVAGAAQVACPAGEQAMADLCRAYWYPLYCFARQRGFDPLESQDLTQDFFVHCLEKNVFAVVDPNRGRFRTFLRVAMANHLAHARERAAAKRRGGGIEMLSLEEEGIERRFCDDVGSEGSPERDFDRRWAMALLESALNRLRAEYVSCGKTELFEELKPMLEGDTGQGECQRIAARLQMTSNAVAVTIHRLRQRYRELIRFEVALTVSNPHEVDTEMRTLLEVLRG